MMGLLRRNFGYKCLSLGFAIVLYWIASGQQNPRITQSLPSVELFVTGLPATLVMRAPTPEEMISVSGPAAAVDAFRAQQRKATVDLTQAEPGTHSYPIQYNLPPGYGNDLVVTGPQMVQISLERKARQTFYVDVLFDNTPPAGYAYTDPRATPDQVVVEGSASDLARVQRVVASLNNAGSPGALSSDVTLVAQDKNLQPVDGVTLTPKQARVTLNLKRAPATKTVVLSADLNGTPASGSFINNYNFWPPTLKVSGPPDLLSSRSSLSVPVDVDGIHQSVTRMVTVQPPAGLTIVGSLSAVRLRLDVKTVAPVTPSPPSGAASPPNVPMTSPGPGGVAGSAAAPRIAQ
jgi:YbbR domain-containing protein